MLLGQLVGQKGESKVHIGLFGGTFDPPHLGHLVLADRVLDELGLDQIWFVVANDPWQKVGMRTITPAQQRLELVSAAIGDAPGFQVSAVELESGGPSYTYDTLATLISRHPEYSWTVIVGQDAAAGLETWHRAPELKAEAEFVVVNRPGSGAMMPVGWRLTAVEIPSLDISSTGIRERVASGRSIRFLVPPRVIALIDRWEIYSQPQ